MTVTYATNFFLCGVMMALMIAGIIISVITPDIENWNRKFFITLFTILTLLVISYFVDSFLLLCSNTAIAGRTLIFFQYLFIPIIMFMFTIFLLHSDFIRRLFNFAWNNAVYGNFLLHHGGKYFLSERITFSLNVAVNSDSGFEFIRCRQTQKNFVEKIFSVIYG